MWEMLNELSVKTVRFIRSATWQQSQDALRFSATVGEQWPLALSKSYQDLPM